MVAPVILARRKWEVGSGAEGHPSEFENLPQNEEKIKANNLSALRYVSVCNFSARMYELKNSAFDLLTENSLLTFTPALPLNPKHHS